MIARVLSAADCAGDGGFPADPAADAVPRPLLPQSTAQHQE